MRNTMAARRVATAIGGPPGLSFQAGLLADLGALVDPELDAVSSRRLSAALLDLWGLPMALVDALLPDDDGRCRSGEPSVRAALDVAQVAVAQVLGVEDAGGRASERVEDAGGRASEVDDRLVALAADAILTHMG